MWLRRRKAKDTPSGEKEDTGKPGDGFVRAPRRRGRHQGAGRFEQCFLARCSSFPSRNWSPVFREWQARVEAASASASALSTRDIRAIRRALLEVLSIALFVLCAFAVSFAPRHHHCHRLANVRRRHLPVRTAHVVGAQSENNGRLDVPPRSVCAMRMSRHYHPAVHFKPTMESDDHASSHKLTTRSNSLCAREKQVQHRSLPTTFSIHHLTLYICILFFLSASVVHGKRSPNHTIVVHTNRGFLFSASSEKPTLLLFANRKDIRLMNAENVKNTTIFSNQLEEAAAVDFYYAEEIIFWTDIGLEMIKGLRLNGSTRNVFNVITNGIMSPDGLACDWLTKKLYWADSDTNRIEVCEFDGKNRKVLFWENLDMPRAIALVPQKG